jgi:hypothetical protein
MRWPPPTLMVLSFHQVATKKCSKKDEGGIRVCLQLQLWLQTLITCSTQWAWVGCKVVKWSHHWCSRCAYHYVDNSKFVQNFNKLYFTKVWGINHLSCPHHWIPWLVHRWCPLVCGQLIKLTVATLTLGSRPKQRLAKLHAKNETRKSHFMLLGGWEDGRVWELNLHIPKWTPNFGNWSPDGLPNFQGAIAGVKIHWIKEFLISLKSSWNLDV